MKRSRSSRRTRIAARSRQPIRARRKPSIRSADDFFAQPVRVQRTLRRVADALSRMRAGTSFHRAARAAGTSGPTLRRWAGSALRKAPNGRYVVQRSDRLVRVLHVLTVDGMREGAFDSRQARVVAEHWNAVHKHLAKGETAAVDRFRDAHVTDRDGNRLTLLTDPAALDHLGAAGVLSFESIYARTI